MRSPLRLFLVNSGTAILSVVVAILGTLLVRPIIQPITTPLFLAAIIFTAWRCGKRPGLFATLLSGLVIDYIFISPRFQLSGHWDDIGRISLFMIEGGILCWMIDSRLKAEKEVRQSREELRALYGDLQSLVEEERARIAREIHDELGTELTGLKFEVSWLRDQAAKMPNSELERYNETLEHIDTAIASVRRIATELRPAVLDTLGLTAAIEWQAKEFENRTGIVCRLRTMDEDLPPDPVRDTSVFRVFQESLTNVARHSEASMVHVGLERNDGHLKLTIRDNGIGINEGTNSGIQSLGILGMRERVRLLNGTLTISSPPSRGTLIDLDIPIANGAESTTTVEVTVSDD